MRFFYVVNYLSIHDLFLKSSLSQWRSFSLREIEI
jgi:hypothetical protein